VEGQLAHELRGPHDGQGEPHAHAASAASDAVQGVVPVAVSGQTETVATAEAVATADRQQRVLVHAGDAVRHGPPSGRVEETGRFVQQRPIPGFLQVGCQGVRDPNGRIHIHAQVVRGAGKLVVLPYGSSVGKLIRQRLQQFAAHEGGIEIADAGQILQNVAIAHHVQGAYETGLMTGLELGPDIEEAIHFVVAGTDQVGAAALVPDAARRLQGPCGAGPGQIAPLAALRGGAAGIGRGGAQHEAQRFFLARPQCDRLLQGADHAGVGRLARRIAAASGHDGGGEIAENTVAVKAFAREIVSVHRCIGHQQTRARRGIVLIVVEGRHGPVAGVVEPPADDAHVEIVGRIGAQSPMDAREEGQSAAAPAAIAQPYRPDFQRIVRRHEDVQRRFQIATERADFQFSRPLPAREVADGRLVPTRLRQQEPDVLGASLFVAPGALAVFLAKIEGARVRVARTGGDVAGVLMGRDRTGQHAFQAGKAAPGDIPERAVNAASARVGRTEQMQIGARRVQGVHAMDAVVQKAAGVAAVLEAAEGGLRRARFRCADSVQGGQAVS